MNEQKFQCWKCENEFLLENLAVVDMTAACSICQDCFNKEYNQGDSILRMINDKEKLIKLIWDEYHHGYEGAKSSLLSRLEFSGHAQCALNLLSRLGEDCTQQHNDMAQIFKENLRALGVEI